MKKIYSSDINLIVPVLAQGQCCDLKIDDGKHRVWLCRVGGGVTVETLHRGRWEVTSGNCTALRAVL